MPLSREEERRLLDLEKLCTTNQVNIENWIKIGEDVHRRSEHRIDELDRQLREGFAVIERMIEDQAAKLRDDHASQAIANQGFTAGLSTVTSRIENTKGDVSEMERQMSRKTDSRQVAGILEHKMLLILIALWVPVSTIGAGLMVDVIKTVVLHKP